MNQVIISGRLTKDPEVRSTQSGKMVTKFTTAIYGGPNKTDFVNCVAWNKTAEFIERYFKKGDGIELEGKLQSGSYEKDGKKVYTLDVIVNNVSFPPAKKAEKRSEETSVESLGLLPAPADEDLPF